MMGFILEPDVEVTLNAIPGEVLVEGIDSNNAEASMEVKCPRLSGPCADHFRDLEFDIIRSGKKVTIGANKGTLFRGNSEVKTTIALPRIDCLKVKTIAGDVDISRVQVNSLEVDMKAGDLDINVEQLENLKVDLEAGDVDITIPEASVAEVNLDAGIGDASINRHGRHEDAPRSFLVGAETQRQISREGAIIRVDVQFGDIDVNLIP
jgi:phosphohistidine swiveling domain-containing protein